MDTLSLEWHVVTDERHVSNARAALRVYNAAVPAGGDTFFLEDLCKMTTLTEPPPPESSGLTYCHYNFIASCEATGSAARFFAEVEVDHEGAAVGGGEDGVVACCILQISRDYGVNCNACFRQRSFLMHPSDRNKFIAGHRLLPEHKEDDCEIEYDYDYPYFD
ncbi:hypothetical protein OsI_33134 [Oryza sativa Indica Group]|uniref:DUF3615 domain-containing protein n=2 Tax=Oryza TaxID=4527 RepID=A0A0E0IQR6_ORYNI|nr:hypothetical protein OsI_33134 [Oryza sativa Indica Group]